MDGASPTWYYLLAFGFGWAALSWLVLAAFVLQHGGRALEGICALLMCGGFITIAVRYFSFARGEVAYEVPTYVLLGCGALCFASVTGACASIYGLVTGRPSK